MTSSSEKATGRGAKSMVSIPNNIRTPGPAVDPRLQLRAIAALEHAQCDRAQALAKASTVKQMELELRAAGAEALAAIMEDLNR